MIRIIIIEDEAAAAERLEKMLMTMPFDIKIIKNDETIFQRSWRR